MTLNSFFFNATMNNLFRKHTKYSYPPRSRGSEGSTHCYYVLIINLLLLSTFFHFVKIISLSDGRIFGVFWQLFWRWLLQVVLRYMSLNIL